ncbi:MAG TPA: Sec-dependent nitrous-oxide reductase [Thermoanaerobaculia bacterium]|nr:Sec-dependent nitrous-oxide reductase [Thermoanaerobaculia bacterium]
MIAKRNHRLGALLPLALVAAVLGTAWFFGCKSGPTEQAGRIVAPGDVDGVIAARGLTPADVYAAVKTYVPTGQKDEYVILASGGHSGQMLVIGVPSMRLLKVVGVFTPEPWQGWGYSDETKAILGQGQVEGRDITWGDTHHPAISETAGDYDGQYVFINDKAHARIAVIDLRDFETKQILKNPVSLSDHGGTMVTPDTEYVIEGGQYAAPLGWRYAALEDYENAYRGMVTFWKFDRDAGRIDQQRSFAIELPPYWQDICDAGKLVSDGWAFCNSINTELATGGIEQGKPPFESGVSQRDMDYLHVIDWRKAAELVAAGRARQVEGFDVIPLEVAAAEGVLFFVPEPKSPHGVDVAPGGEYIVVSGKLDPHVTVYSFEKIQRAIADRTFSGKDQFGVPVIDFDAALETQIELGLGPLHTQFDDKGYGYTSLFLDSAVARWSLGGPYADKHGEAESWQMVQKIPVHYNIGHLAVAEGDTVSPDGNWLVAMNKWSVDRFLTVGPLHPQNFQLIDISGKGETMQLLYDMAIGIGEPHYAQIIKADKLAAWDVYPEIGWDPAVQAVRTGAPALGQERIERRGNTVEIWMTGVRSHFTPEHVEIQKGDHVIWHITNVETAKDATHGFALPAYNINLSLEPGETTTIEFVAEREGVYTWYCSEFCSALHLEMVGYLTIKPS